MTLNRYNCRQLKGDGDANGNVWWIGETPYADTPIRFPHADTSPLWPILSVPSE
jgi:hypothetical protein